MKAGIVAIVTPEEWRAKFEKHAASKLAKKMCTARIEKLARRGEGCFVREYVGEKPNKEVKFPAFKKSNEVKTKKFCSDQAMDRSIYEKDCLEPVEYAYNNEGSLFPLKFAECNVHRLDTLLQMQTYAYGNFAADGGFTRYQVPGITNSMLYIGAYGSTFPWHTEDADLPSVNYMHQGDAKIWFSIPAS